MKRMSSSRPLLLFNIGQLVTMQSADGRCPRRGEELKELGVIQDGAVLCAGGKIVSTGKTKDALRDGWVKRNRRAVVEIDCRGKLVLPGFVDSHTHPSFISPRLVDFEERIAGASYERSAKRSLFGCLNLHGKMDCP